MSEEIAGLIVTVDTRQVEEGVNDLERLANASIGVERNIQRAASGFSSYSSTIRQLSPLLTSTVYSLNSSNSAFQLMGEHASAASARMIAGMSGAASASQIANSAIHAATGNMTAGLNSAATASQHAANAASEALASMSTRNRASMSAMTESMMQSLNSINSTLNQMESRLATSGHSIRQVTSSLEGQVQPVNNLTNSIRGLIASYVGFQTVKGVVDTGDDMLLLTARIQNATQSTEEFKQAQSALIKLSLETHSALSANATLFSRVNEQVRSLGGNIQTTAALTKLMSEGLAASGAGAAESASVIRQFSQAMASGVLRGEEFNAIMENGQVIADQLAAALGVTKGELRAMAESGELSIAKVTNALLKNANVIDQKYKNMPLTVGKAIEDIKTKFSLLVDEQNKITGSTSTMAAALEGVANNLKPIIGALLGFGTVTGLIWAAQKAMLAFNLALASNPLGLAMVAAATAIGLVIGKIGQAKSEYEAFMTKAATLDEQNLKIKEQIAKIQAMTPTAKGYASFKVEKGTAMKDLETLIKQRNEMLNESSNLEIKLLDENAKKSIGLSKDQVNAYEDLADSKIELVKNSSDVALSVVAQELKSLEILYKNGSISIKDYFEQNNALISKQFEIETNAVKQQLQIVNDELNGLKVSIPTIDINVNKVKIKDEIQQAIDAASKTYKVDPNLVKSVILAESSYNPKAVSSAGAKGLMQIMPATGASYGVTEKELFDIKKNIDVGTHLLADLLKTFKNDVTLVAAAYNAGPNAVKKAGNKVPNYPETKDYVNKVNSGFINYSAGSKDKDFLSTQSRYNDLTSKSIELEAQLAEIIGKKKLAQMESSSDQAKLLSDMLKRGETVKDVAKNELNYLTQVKEAFGNQLPDDKFNQIAAGILDKFRDSAIQAITPFEKFNEAMAKLNATTETSFVSAEGYKQQQLDIGLAYISNAEKLGNLTDSYTGYQEAINAANQLLLSGVLNTDQYNKIVDAQVESLSKAKDETGLYMQSLQALQDIKDQTADTSALALQAELLQSQGLSTEEIKKQITYQQELNKAAEKYPNLSKSQIEEVYQYKFDAEERLQKVIGKGTDEQSTAYKRMLENIQDAGAKMFEDLFNGDGVKSFTSFLDTIKSAFIKVISNDFSRALGTLFSGAKTDWAGIFSGALAVGVSAIANVLTSDKKTTTPSYATTTQNTNAYGTGAMAIGDTSGRATYINSVSETARKYNEQLSLLTTIIRDSGTKIWELAGSYVMKFVTKLFGAETIGALSKFVSGLSSAYNSVVSFGTELIGGVTKIVSNAWNAIGGVTQAASGATSSATTAAGSSTGTASSSSGSAVPYAAQVIALVMLGYNLFQIAANNYTTTLEKVSESFYAAESAAVAILGVANPIAWIVGGILRVFGSVTQMLSGDLMGGVSNLLGGHIGGLIADMFKNDPSATILSYTKANPESQYDQSGSYYTSTGTQSASVGVETPFGFVDARLNDVGNVVGTKEAIDSFLPLLKTIQAFDVALAASINNVDAMFGETGTIDKFKGLFKQTEHQQDLSGLNTADFISQRLDDISKVMGETGTRAGETFSVWWTAFSQKLLKPASNENAQYNATTSFNIEAFIAAQLPKLAQLPVKLADLFVASVKSVADGATQQEFEGQMNDFFTGWTIAEEGLKQVGININNTYLPEYLTSLTKIGFTVKDGAIALVKYADTFAYAGSTASDKFNEAFNKIFENAKNKNYNTEQTTGFISSYTTFGGIFKDLGISTTNEQLTTFADKLNSTSMMATQAANDLIDHAIADAGMGNKSRDAAIQLLVLQGKLDDTKIAAASFGAALVKEQQRIMEGIDFVAQIAAGTGVKFDSLGLSATDLLGVSDLLIQRFGDMKTAISETSAFIETAFGKPALTQFQSNQAYSQQQSIIDRNPQFAEYGLFAGMNSQQLQAANSAASQALKIDMNQLIANGTKLMVENPDLQTFVNLTKSFDTQANPNGYKYNTNFNNSVTNAVTTSATESTVNTTVSDNAKTLSDLQKTINDRLKEIGNTEIQNSIISVTNKIQEMVVSAKAAGGELKNISELQAAELRVIFKPTVEEFNNIGKTDIQKSLDSINTWASEMIAVAPDIAAAYNQSTSEILSGIDKLKDSKAQEIFNDVVDEFNNLGKTDYQKSLEGIEEWAGNMIAVSSDLAAAYNISTQTALDGIATVKQARIDALNAEKEKIITDAKTTYSRLGATDLENELYSLRDSFYGTITDLVKNGGNLEQAALLITIAMDTGYKAFQRAAQAVKDSAASIQKEINAKGFTISDKIVELTNPKGLDEVQRARALADINSTNYQDQLTAVDTLYNLAMAKHDAEMEKYNKEIERINSIKTSIAGIKDFIDSFKVSTDSLISPEDRLKESRAQYQTQLALARAGDETAMGKVQGAFSTYIDANKDYYGSTSPTQDAITQGLKDLGELTLKSNDPQVNIENYTRNTVTELQTLQGVLRTISQQQTDKLSSDLKALETQTGKIGQDFMQSMYTLGAQFGVTAAQIDAAIKAIRDGLTVKPVTTPTPAPTNPIPSVLPDTMNPNSPNFIGPVNPNPLPAVFNPSNPNFVGPIQPGSKPITYAQPSVNTANLSPSSPMYIAGISGYGGGNNTTVINNPVAPVKKKSDADIAYFDNLIAKGSYSQAASYAKSYGYSNSEIATYVSALNGSSQSSVMSWLKANGYEKGGDYPGGLAMVGEKGPELINFNQGGHISTAAQTKELLSKPDKKESSAELERKLEEQNKLIAKLIQLTQAAAQETISESKAQTQELKGIHQKTRIKEGVK